MIPKVYYCAQDNNYYSIQGVNCVKCLSSHRDVMTLVEQWSKNRPCTVEFYCNSCSGHIPERGADVITKRVVIIADDLAEIPRGHLLVPLLPPALAPGRYESSFQAAIVHEEGVTIIDNRKLAFRNPQLILSFEEQNKKLIQSRIVELDSPVENVDVFFKKVNLSYPETKYPSCPDCKLRCHGCKICGFIFTCSSCNPCHEDIVIDEGVLI